MEGVNDVLDVGDDGFFFVGHFGEEVALEFAVDVEFDFFGVDEDEFELAGVFFVQQGGDDGVESYGFSLSGGAGYEEVGGFGEVEDEGFVGDGFAEGYGEFVFAALEFFAGDDAAHGDDFGFGVGDFDADGAFAGDGGDDADAEGAEAEGDVVFEAFYFGDADAGHGYDFVEGDGGPYGGFDAFDLYFIVFEGFDDFVFELDEFLLGDAALAGLVLFEEVEGGHFVGGEVEGGVVVAQGLLTGAVEGFFGGGLFDLEAVVGFDAVLVVEVVLGVELYDGGCFWLFRLRWCRGRLAGNTYGVIEFGAGLGF